MEEFNPDTDFELKNLYQNYLETSNLNDKNMTLNQKIETRRAFMGGCSSVLKVIREGMGTMPEEKAYGVLNQMFDESVAFWEKEVGNKSIPQDDVG